MQSEMFERRAISMAWAPSTASITEKPFCLNAQRQLPGFVEKQCRFVRAFDKAYLFFGAYQNL
jgi:hypothetical protein